MTCEELLKVAREGRPNVRYAKNANETAIAAWWEGRWVPVAALAVTGKWVEMPGELFVDGIPMHAGETWIE